MEPKRGFFDDSYQGLLSKHRSGDAWEIRTHLFIHEGQEGVEGISQ